MACIWKKYRAERKKAKALAEQKAAVVDLPTYILSNYRAAAKARTAEAQAALQEVQASYAPSRS